MGEAGGQGRGLHPSAFLSPTCSAPALHSSRHQKNGAMETLAVCLFLPCFSAPCVPGTVHGDFADGSEAIMSLP